MPKDFNRALALLNAADEQSDRLRPTTWRACITRALGVTQSELQAERFFGDLCREATSRHFVRWRCYMRTKGASNARAFRLAARAVD